MLDFEDHPRFEKEVKQLEKRHIALRAALESFKRLCHIQFHPDCPRPVIGPGKIHRLRDCGTYELWKVEIHGKGLRKNQGPRVWFARRGTRIVFLGAASHVDDYDDGSMSHQAAERASDLL